MKTSMLVLLGIALLTGCASHYVVTLTNGQRVLATTKPQLQNGYYRFKDASGKNTVVAPHHVSEIAPESMSEDPMSKFKVSR